MKFVPWYASKIKIDKPILHAMENLSYKKAITSWKKVKCTSTNITLGWFVGSSETKKVRVAIKQSKILCSFKILQQKFLFKVRILTTYPTSLKQKKCIEMVKQIDSNLPFP